MAENSSEDKSGVSTDSTSDVEPSSHSSTNWRVLGETSANDGVGVLGHATSGSGVTRGVKGVIDSNTSHASAVRGDATADAGIVNGVDGRSRGNPDGTGVLGLAVSDSFTFSPATGFPIGLWGETDRSAADSGVTNAFGVLGNTHASSGETYGISGANFNSPSGVAVRGWDLHGDGLGVLAKGGSKTEGNDEVTGHRSTGMVGVDAYLETDETVQDGTRTTVPFDQTRRDDFTGMNQSDTGKYTVQAAGDYHVDFTISWADIFSGDNVDYALLAPGYEFIEDVEHSSNESIGFSKTVFDMSVGDDIYVEVEQFSGGPMDIDGTGRGDTYMTIHKVG